MLSGFMKVHQDLHAAFEAFERLEGSRDIKSLGQRSHLAQYNTIISKQALCGKSRHEKAGGPRCYPESTSGFAFCPSCMGS